MNNENASPFRKNNSKKIIIIILCVVLLAAITVGALFYFMGSTKSGTRQNLDGPLREVAELMEESVRRGDGYPTTIPAKFTAPDGVEVVGGGSFDGTSYCVTATLTADKTQQSYISSETSEVREGSCETATDLPKPGLVGMPSISVVGPTQIVTSWQVASNATKYTMQCSTDRNFEKNVITVDSSELSGTCDDLKDGTQYFVRVRAENSQPGDWSEALETSTSKLPKLN